MRFLTPEDCAAWIAERGYPTKLDERGRTAPDLASGFAWQPVDFPVDSGKKVALARRVIRDLQLHGGGLLWVTAWGVWPSSEHMPLFDAFRREKGETRPMIDAPGHLVPGKATDDAVSVLLASLLFFWDCYVFSATGGAAFFCSHDEFAGFHFTPQGTRAFVES